MLNDFLQSGAIDANRQIAFSVEIREAHWHISIFAQNNIRIFYGIRIMKKQKIRGNPCYRRHASDAVRVQKFFFFSL
jgi:hypothetical protein